MPKRPYSAGYFSSYDRGLECLLDMWPRMRKQVPEATLDVYYGWGAFDAGYRSNPMMMKWRWLMTRKLFDLRDQGVTEHGRVSHEDLAKAMQQLRVWLYPTEFTEISCITAIKAQAAGMIPVTTHCYALEETVKAAEPVVLDIYTNESAQEAFVKRAAEALNEIREQPTWNMDEYGWDRIASQWSEVCT